MYILYGIYIYMVFGAQGENSFVDQTPVTTHRDQYHTYDDAIHGQQPTKIQKNIKCTHLPRRRRQFMAICISVDVICIHHIHHTPIGRGGKMGKYNAKPANLIVTYNFHLFRSKCKLYLHWHWHGRPAYTHALPLRIYTNKYSIIFKYIWRNGTVENIFQNVRIWAVRLILARVFFAGIFFSVIFFFFSFFIGLAWWAVLLFFIDKRAVYYTLAIFYLIHILQSPSMRWNCVVFAHWRPVRLFAHHCLLCCCQNRIYSKSHPLFFFFRCFFSALGTIRMTEGRDVVFL